MNFGRNVKGNGVVKERLEQVKERIAAACQKANRHPSEVKIVAVTKTHPVDVVREVIEAGINDIGENRVQEAEQKYSQIISDYSNTEKGISSNPPNQDNLQWHMVGHLQRNKVKKAVSIFSMIHSVDSLRLAEEIEKESVIRDRLTPCLIEVNCSGEESKFGVSPNDLATLMSNILKMEHIKLVGLMTIGPLCEDSGRIRSAFSLLRELRDRAENVFGCYLPHLSMGMSDDFEIAVEEGATIIRLGRVLLGRRNSAEGLTSP